MAFNLEKIICARAHVQSSNMHRTKTHLKVPNGGNNVKTSYQSSSVEERDLSHMVLVADISLPHCQATGI